MEYIIALQVGGLMEQPEITHHDAEVIEANNEKEAVEIYNEKNKCSFFYGDSVAKLQFGLGWQIIDNKVTKYWLKDQLNKINNA